MRHARFALAQVHVDDLELPLVQGDLLVVKRDESSDLDWELVTTTASITALHPRPCRLTMAVLEDGRLLEGDALVVRSDERSHVFRGAGDLGGLRPDDGLYEVEG